MFCDESPIELFPEDKRLRVRRREGERYKSKNIAHVYHHEGGNLMFWGCISLYGQGELIKVTGTLKGASYAQLLSQSIPGSSLILNRRFSWLLQDHASCHDTVGVTDVIRSLGLERLNSPSNSPDLNPIESLWGYWKDKVRSRHPQNLVQLEQYAIEEWRNIPLEIVRSYIENMAKRLLEVYRMRGEYTKY